MFKTSRPAVISSFFLAALFACTTQEAKTSDQSVTTNAPELTQDSLVKRGDYLVATLGCDDCHSPKSLGPQGPQLDMDHRLGGYPQSRPLPAIPSEALKAGWVVMAGDLTATVGPWGVSYSSNITSDSTGIGNWTEAQFFTAIRQGKSKGLESNRMLLPPMPWQNLSKLTDTDIRSIFAYLKSTKPVRNTVPAPKPPTNM